MKEIISVGDFNDLFLLVDEDSITYFVFKYELTWFKFYPNQVAPFLSLIFN